MSSSLAHDDGKNPIGLPDGAGSIAEFRASVADWFATNSPRDWRERFDHVPSTEQVSFQREWLAKLNEVGYGAPHVPTEWGGGGLSVLEQTVLYEEWARSEAPRVSAFLISLQHMPATLLAAGTDEQQRQFIRDGIDGTLWCQGFSEPEAGSDLASLRTSARLDGDSYIVNGQKIWSSYSMHAKWCLLLARTDQSAPKRKGISYFILDMSAPGVEVRPIRQNNGRAEFGEIFLTDVEIPASRMIGGENDGWRIAQTTLATERGPISVETIEHIRVALARMCREVELADVDRDENLAEAHARLALCASRAEAVRSLALDMVDATSTGTDRADLASIVKVAYTELVHDVTDFAAMRQGMASLVDPGYGPLRGNISGHAMTDFVSSWGLTISSGTNEIQRNIIAERVLGLPREPVQGVVQ